MLELSEKQATNLITFIVVAGALRMGYCLVTPDSGCLNNWLAPANNSLGWKASMQLGMLAIIIILLLTKHRCP